MHYEWDDIKNQQELQGVSANKLASSKSLGAKLRPSRAGIRLEPIPSGKIEVWSQMRCKRAQESRCLRVGHHLLLLTVL